MKEDDQNKPIHEDDEEESESSSEEEEFEQQLPTADPLSPVKISNPTGDQSSVYSLSDQENEEEPDLPIAIQPVLKKQPLANEFSSSDEESEESAAPQEKPNDFLGELASKIGGVPVSKSKKSDQVEIAQASPAPSIKSIKSNASSKTSKLSSKSESKPKSKTVSKPVKQALPVKKSIFDSDDSDDDLFSGKPSRSKPKPEVPSQTLPETSKPKTVETVEPVPNVKQDVQDSPKVESEPKNIKVVSNLFADLSDDDSDFESLFDKPKAVAKVNEDPLLVQDPPTQNNVTDSLKPEPQGPNLIAQSLTKSKKSTLFDSDSDSSEDEFDSMFTKPKETKTKEATEKETNDNNHHEFVDNDDPDGNVVSASKRMVKSIPPKKTKPEPTISKSTKTKVIDNNTEPINAVKDHDRTAQSDSKKSDNKPPSDKLKEPPPPSKIEANAVPENKADIVEIQNQDPDPVEAPVMLVHSTKFRAQAGRQKRRPPTRAGRKAKIESSTEETLFQDSTKVKPTQSEDTADSAILVANDSINANKNEHEKETIDYSLEKDKEENIDEIKPKKVLAPKVPSPFLNELQGKLKKSSPDNTPTKEPIPKEITEVPDNHERKQVEDAYAEPFKSKAIEDPVVTKVNGPATSNKIVDLESKQVHVESIDPINSKLEAENPTYGPVSKSKIKAVSEDFPAKSVDLSKTVNATTSDVTESKDEINGARPKLLPKKSSNPLLDSSSSDEDLFAISSKSKSKNTIQQDKLNVPGQEASRDSSVGNSKSSSPLFGPPPDSDGANGSGTGTAGPSLEKKDPFFESSSDDEDLFATPNSSVHGSKPMLNTTRSSIHQVSLFDDNDSDSDDDLFKTVPPSSRSQSKKTTTNRDPDPLQ